MAKKPSLAQLSALRWLSTNGGLEVPNMNLGGRSREWPTHRTLKALLRDGLIDFEQGTLSWKVSINDAGREQLASLMRG